MECLTEVGHLVSTVEDVNLQDHDHDNGIEHLVNARKNELDTTRKNYRSLPHLNEDPLKCLSKYFGPMPQ